MTRIEPYKIRMSLRDDSIWDVSAIYNPEQNKRGEIIRASTRAKKNALDRFSAITLGDDTLIEIENVPNGNYLSLLVADERRNYLLKEGKMMLFRNGRISIAGNLIPSVARENIPLEEITRNLPLDLVMKLMWMNFQRDSEEEIRELAYQKEISEHLRRNFL
jgi:hypothetical protein